MTSKLGRRDFLRATAAAAAAGSILCHSTTAPADQPEPAESKADKPARPDILLIMPDQMRGDCLSVLDHPVVHTPQLDALARGGVLFRRAYTTVPSCIPARYGMMTGLAPQTSGVVGFAAKVISTPTLPDQLNKAGYKTFLIGRNMHQKTDCGYSKSILGSTYVSNDDYDKFLKKADPQSGGIRKVINRIGVTCNFWQAHPWPLAEKLHPNDWIVAQSRDVLAQLDPAQPVFLTTSFYSPHPPLFPPKKYFDKCEKQKLPAIARGDWVDWKAIPVVSDKDPWNRKDAEGDRARDRVVLQGQVLRDAQSGYFGLINQIDDQIAPLIAQFKARSEKAGREWVIVFTSDHGEMLGDHGYFRKCEPYEPSSNIPFIFAASKNLGFKPGLRIQQPVCLEDIMPTLLALAGAKCPDFVDGVNLLPTLQGRKQQIRQWLHFEHSPCYSREQAFQALTDGHFKYIWRTTSGDEQLFDIDNDPTEIHDLSKNPAYKKQLATWRARMVERLKDRPEGFVQDGKLIAGRPYRALNEGTLGAKA